MNLVYIYIYYLLTFVVFFLELSGFKGFFFSTIHHSHQTSSLQREVCTPKSMSIKCVVVLNLEIQMRHFDRSDQTNQNRICNTWCGVARACHEFSGF